MLAGIFGGATLVLKLWEVALCEAHFLLVLNYGVDHIGFIHTTAREGGEGHFSRLGVSGAKQQTYSPVVVSSCSSTHIHLAFVFCSPREQCQRFFLLLLIFFVGGYMGFIFTLLVAGWASG